MSKLLQVLKRYRQLHAFFLQKEQINLGNIHAKIDATQQCLKELEKNTLSYLDFLQEHPSTLMNSTYLDFIEKEKKRTINDHEALLHEKTLQQERLQQAYREHEVSKTIQKNAHDQHKAELERKEQKFIDDLMKK
jgi:hypothetical protein